MLGMATDRCGCPEDDSPAEDEGGPWGTGIGAFPLHEPRPATAANWVAEASCSDREGPCELMAAQLLGGFPRVGGAPCRSGERPNCGLATEGSDGHC